MKVTETNFKNKESSIKKLETQIGQLAEQLANRDEGRFPGSTIVNSKEQCQAITIRSGAVVSSPRKKNEVTNLNEENELKQEDFESVKYTMLKRGEEENCCNKQEKKGKKQRFEQACKPINEEQYKRLPFPKRVQDPRQEKQFERFIDVFKKLQINIPFVEALEQMPSYAKFMKELLSKKRKLDKEKLVPLTEECRKALCDLGASINLMPLAIMKKLEIKEVKPTRITLQLADESYTYPYGVVEDLLVKVDKFIFPTDFVKLDMEVDADIPLISGRPFLATGRALIDV
ncbi:uncharacterized protein LOC113850650 [Abrus precatorius]|uniref:Uncharacterized protein LOC113850650 n=1 Tax=Abrus precatorius TaxID=3816 RepID=A0A8B8K0M9_ABRPR|nr:uncharacterized protein LOC113850650 [Abrus precatorius]